ncbi:signal transduction histidine kinase [Streptomyces sp. V4I23]|uniref:sensor histidine kinase n=1 Tax=Streptomyces sp. V4I23 TaxID=3042282 RepID=UPI002783A40B|nr:nitrate- and nitrite sensing domain-containing protein [Streptomyces sp. V4I23]MDQ1012414.1 signal transduction histidine kinase [Streptomyces sp. V4I23]
MRRLYRPENWRVRHKLTAVVLFPGLLAAAMAVVSISHTIGDANDHRRFSEMARLQQPALDLVRALQDERDVTASFIRGRREAADTDPREQRAEVDTAVAAYRSAAAGIDTTDDPQLDTVLQDIARELGSLPALRTSVDRANLTQSSILANYTTAIRRLLDIGPALASRNGGSAAASHVHSLNALSRATENTSRVRASLNSVLTTRTFLVGQFPDFAGTVARQQESINEFMTTASTEQRSLYADTVKGVPVSTAHAIQERATEQAQSARIDVDPAAWHRASSHKITLMREVEAEILADLVAVSSEAHASRERVALWSAVGLAAVFAATGCVITAVVRSLTRPLARLRMSALEVANERLPEALTRLRQAHVDDLDGYRSTPTGVASDDEIGEVAEAFDAVQNAAVALVRDQAALRAHINGMFIHLSRRNQQRVGRLLTEIGDLEQHERDPDHLARLFRLDHLATQMLRTDESLLVLAGSDTGRIWEQPMPLADIMLAAGAEVEQYTRIDYRPLVTADVAADAVTDLVHLLAELMENATDFSGADTRVTVTCGMAPDRLSDLLISIQDHGTGMTPEHLAAVNQRLASASSLDPGAGRSMGLIVVGRLAAKHGVHVHLVSGVQRGTTALVRIPASLLTARHHGAPAVTHEQCPPTADRPVSRSEPARLSCQGTADDPGTADDNGFPRGAPHSTDAAPAFSSPQEWLTQRRFAQRLHSGDTPAPCPLPPARSGSTPPDTEGRL